MARAVLVAVTVLVWQTPVSAEVVVAVAGPASGREASRTAATLSGAKKAAETLNAKGGINGEPVSVVSADDGCDSTRAAALAADLSLQKVALVLGHPCTASALAAAKVYAEKGVLYIATSSRHPALTSPRAGATIFRLSGRDDRQGDEAGRYLAETFKGKPVAIVNDRTRYARRIADAVAAVLTKAGAPAPITATLIGGEKDFPLVTAKVKNAAAIFYAGYPLEAGMLTGQIRAAKSEAETLLSDSNATREFADTFGASVQGVRVMRPQFGLEEADEDSDTETRLAAADSSLAEAAVETLAFAATEAKSTDAASVGAIMSARVITTSRGAVSFDASGDARRPSFDVYTWSGAAWKRAR